MSAISSIGSASAYAPPVPANPTTPNAPTAPAAKPPAAATSAAAGAVAKAASQGSYKNAAGDTVSLGGIVLVDHDGDGGVGLPAPKAKPAASDLQGKLANTYSTH